jgi:DNA sulfur modification protein DndB
MSIGLTNIGSYAYKLDIPMAKDTNKRMTADIVPSLSFPVIRGTQAGREYFVAMWSLRTLRQISIFDDRELPPELRAQRVLNRARIPEITGYILDNPDDYVFSALTVSIDSQVSFEPLQDQDRLGILKVPMDAKFIVNDGQHRRAAIIEALEHRPELANESIAVVFFLDIGLQKSQQMFADLNRHGIRPSRSIGILYDHRSETAKLAKLAIMKSPLFRDIIDMEKTSLAIRSRKLFTLSAFCNACNDLMNGIQTGKLEEDAAQARSFWEAVSEHFPAWRKVKSGQQPASEIREGFIHGHGIALHALGIAGNALLKAHPKNWKSKLSHLAEIDWSRSNSNLWEGRALIGGKVSKATTNVTLTSNVIKTALGIPLNPRESEIEQAHSQN